MIAHLVHAARRIRRPLLVLALLLGALTVVLGPAAVADPGGCHQPPEPARHGEGFVGQLDNAGLGQGVTGSPYYEQGYDGLTWSTYGTSGMCSVSYPAAGADTWLGKQLLFAAETLTAAVNGIHYLTLDNVILPNLDGILSELPAVLYDSVFTPYFSVVALLSAVLILWWSHKGDLANIGKKVFWTLAGLTFASLTYLVPLAYTPIVDDVLVHGTAELQGNILKQTGWGDERNGLPDMLYSETLYRPWLMGEFGSDTSPEAQRYGRDLLRSQGCSKVETVRNSCNVEQKQDQYTNIAGQVEHTPAYRYFSGDQGRTSAGFVALIKSGCYSLFQLVCKAGLLLTQIIGRGVVLGGPVLGLVAILNNAVLPKIFRALGGAVGIGILLTLVGTVHAYVLGMVTAPAHGFSEGTQLVIMVLVTWLTWIALRPWRLLRQMAASTIGMQLPDPSQERMARRLRQRRHTLARIGKGLFGMARRAGAGFDRDFWFERGEAQAPSAAGAEQPAPGTQLSHRVGATGGGHTRPEGSRIYVQAERVAPDTEPAPAREPAMSTHSRRELTEAPRALGSGGRDEPPDDPPPRGPNGGPSPNGGPHGGPSDRPHSGPNGPSNAGPRGGPDNGPRPRDLPESRHDGNPPPNSPQPPQDTQRDVDVVVPSEEEQRPHHKPSPAQRSREAQRHRRRQHTANENTESAPPPHRPEREE